MATIKAIETRYKGYRFRSRLEARWAVFFDKMGARWEYEREGFDIPGAGPYLPDFWITGISYRDDQYPAGTPPTPGWYVEIKPVRLTDREEALCRGLAAASNHVVYALAGNVGGGEFTSYKWHPRRLESGGVRAPTGDAIFDRWYDDTFLFYLCSHAARLRADGGYPDRAALDAAFAAARSARFEHGERG